MSALVRSAGRYKIEIAIFLLALAVRCALFGLSVYANHGDIVATVHGDDGYFELSRNLVLGNGLTWDSAPPYMPNPLRPPLYPLFLALPLSLTESYWITILCQMLIGTVIPVLGMIFASRLTGSRNIGLVVGLLLAIEPYSALLSFIFYTETVFTALFLSFLIACLSYLYRHSWRTAFMMGSLLGLAALVKPTVQYVPILMPLGLLLMERRTLNRAVFGHIAAFLAIFVIVIGPWLWRNYTAFGTVGFSAQPAFNLMVYLVPSVRALENGTDFRTEQEHWKAETQLDESAITLRTSAAFRRKAFAELKDHPIGLIKSVGVTALTFFTHDGILVVLQHLGIEPSVHITRPSFLIAFTDPKVFAQIVRQNLNSPFLFVLCARVFWIIISVLFGTGAVLFIKRNGVSAPVLLSLGIVFYFVLTTAINGLGVNARFRIPVNAVLLTFAAYGAAEIFLRFRDKISPVTNHRLIQ